MKKLGGNQGRYTLSAFMLFAGSNRHRIWQSNATASHITLGKLLVEEWEHLQPSERDHYERMAIEDEANRDRAKMIQIAEMEKRNNAKKKKKRDPRAPRPAAVPYTFFFKELLPQFQSQNRDASLGEIGKLLGAAWRNLSEEEKQVYNKMAEDDKIRYQEELLQYQRDLGQVLPSHVS